MRQVHLQFQRRQRAAQGTAAAVMCSSGRLAIFCIGPGGGGVIAVVAPGFVAGTGTMHMRGGFRGHRFMGSAMRSNGGMRAVMQLRHNSGQKEKPGHHRP